MKLNKWLFLLFFTCLGYSQSVFTENFNSFTGIPSGAIGHYQLTNTRTGLSADSVHEDLTANNYDLTISGWSSYANMVDSLTGSSILINGANSLVFTGNNYLSSAETDFRVTTNDYSWFVVLNAKATTSQVYLSQSSGTLSYYGQISGTLRGWFDAVTVNSRTETSMSANTSYVVVVAADRSGLQRMYVNGVQVDSLNISADVATDITSTEPFHIGIFRAAQLLPYSGYIEAAGFYGDLLSKAEAKSVGSIPTGWTTINYNVSRDFSNPDWFLTAWNDTLIVPLPDAALGSNQEWVLTSSNIDDVTAWIGSRSSAKSVKKTITGGVSFASNTTYFGDGFSLVGDSLVVVFTADTASIDNIVLSAETIQLSQTSKKGFGKPFTTGFPKPFK